MYNTIVDGLCFCWDETTPRIPPAPGSGLAQLSDERPCDYFTETIFNSLAPDSQHPYTYDGLCKAIDSYNEGHAEKIFMMGTEEERKSELAAFLGHTLHESDEWKASREYLMCADNKVVDGKTLYPAWMVEAPEHRGPFLSCTPRCLVLPITKAATGTLWSGTFGSHHGY